MRFKNDTMVIIGASEGIIGEYGTIGNRGRELLERQYEARTGSRKNNSPYYRVFYVTLSGELTPMLWKRGQLNDVFFDNNLLPEKARIAPAYRVKIQVV